MALELTKNFDSGFSANYWKVHSVLVDFTSMCATVVAGLYKDATARTEGKAPVELSTYHFSPPETDGFVDTAQDVENVNPQKTAYELLKALPEFEGAVDA